MSEVYKSGPRKINAVSIVVVGAVVLALYGAVRILPVYWDKWQLQEVLRDTCAEIFQARRFGGWTAQKQNEVAAKIHKTMEELGIDDPEATVEFPSEEPTLIVVRASYTVIITHPIGEPTELHFAPEAELDASIPDWDKKR